MTLEDVLHALQLMVPHAETRKPWRPSQCCAHPVTEMGFVIFPAADVLPSARRSTRPLTRLPQGARALLGRSSAPPAQAVTCSAIGLDSHSGPGMSIRSHRRLFERSSVVCRRGGKSQLLWARQTPRPGRARPGAAPLASARGRGTGRRVRARGVAQDDAAETQVGLHVEQRPRRHRQSRASRTASPACSRAPRRWTQRTCGNRFSTCTSRTPATARTLRACTRTTASPRNSTQVVMLAVVLASGGAHRPRQRRNAMRSSVVSNAGLERRGVNDRLGKRRARGVGQRLLDLRAGAPWLQRRQQPSTEHAAPPPVIGRAALHVLLTDRPAPPWTPALPPALDLSRATIGNDHAQQHIDQLPSRRTSRPIKLAVVELRRVAAVRRAAGLPPLAPRLAPAHRASCALERCDRDRPDDTAGVVVLDRGTGMRVTPMP